MGCTTRTSGFDLDSSSERALYQQLFDAIVARIRNGAFPPAHRLPPTRELSRELGVHRNTVVRAYEELESAGFVSSTVGRGTFVAPLDDGLSRRGATPLEATPFDWHALASRAALAEPLGRMNRLPGSAPSDAILLGRMQPSSDLLPYASMRRCFDHVFRTVGSKSLSYAPPEGLPRLRAVIASRLSKSGVPVTTDDVVITTGSQQALDLLARALVNPGEAVLATAATYTGAINLFTSIGARFVSVPSDDEGPDLAALERLSGSNAKFLYLMPNCSNPTGATIASSRREKLVAWSMRARIPIVEDDYGEGLNLDGEPLPPALRAFSKDVIYVGTFSKKLIPALRIGYLVCAKALRNLIVPLKHAMDLGTSTLIQHALAEFIDRGYLDAHMRKSLPEYRQRRDALESALRRHMPKGVTWQHPRHGIVLWLELPRAIDPLRLYEGAAKKGVSITAPTIHTADGQSPQGVRLTFCAEPAARLEEGAKRLGKIARVLEATEAPRGEPQLAATGV